MPTKTKKTPLKSKTHKNTNTNLETKTAALDVESNFGEAPRRKPQFTKIAVVVLLLVALAALILRNKGWFIAATVNGSPIPRWELNDRLSKRYGTQVMEAIIGEKLISDAALKQGVSVGSDEIANRIKDVEKSLNGTMKLDDALKMQGVSKDEFENQVRIQLLIDKMLSKEVSVSATEVDDFLKNSGSLITASDPAQRRTEAEKEVRNNKITEKFQQWFADLKAKAKINRYL